MKQIKAFSPILFILLIGLFGVITAVTAQQPTPPVANGIIAATTYYVANNGNDNNDGLTTTTAWKTLDHVSDQTFQPGDAILLKRGDTWRETLYVTSSGTDSAWITFGAYGTGDKPRILGSKQAVDWTQEATHIWRSGTSVSNPYQGGYSYAEVFFEELDGSYSWGKHQDYNASFSNMTTEYDWSWNANSLYVYALSNPGARYAAVEAPQRDSGIRLPEENSSTGIAEYVAFDNLEIMYTMRHGLYSGYREVEAHGLKVTNSHIGMVGVKGGSSAYCIATWYSDVLIQDNWIHDCGRRGISMNTYTDETPGLTISNVTIDNNYFANGFHTTGPDISSLPGLVHTFTNFTISNNLFDDSARGNAGIHDGCYASSCTSNVIYISAHDSHYSDFTIHNNIIVGATSRAMLLVDMDDVQVYHNTVYGSHPDARPYGLVLFDNVTHIDMRNNIFHGTLTDDIHTDGRLVLDQGASTFSIRDNNLYFQEDDGQPIIGSENGVGGWDVFMYEWDSWQTASGFETNSPDPQRPLFIDREQGDFRLQAGSPAIDAGVIIPGINEGYNDAAPDLGAIEFTPNLVLHGSPANQAINLSWDIDITIPATTTWHIDYYTTTTNILTATDPTSTTRAYTLTGLTNYDLYTVTLKAMVGTTAVLSDTITVMPTDIFVYLPLVLKGD